MSADVRREATLRNGTIFVRSAVGVDGVRAVVLLVRLAVVAGEIGLDLSANADAVADLDCLHVLADLDGFADDLVADADWQWALAPSAGDRVDIAATDTAALNSDVDVAVLEWLELELCDALVRPQEVDDVKEDPYLLLLKVLPVLLVLDHETLGSLWVRHLCCCSGDCEKLMVEKMEVFVMVEGG